MTTNRDWNSTISRLTGWLVGFLALASFVLSYEALWTLAIDSEVNFWLAWLWPLTLDFFVLVASLSILRNSLNGHPRLYAWTLVVVFTALSIVFNAIHKGLPIEVYNVYVLPYVPVVVYVLPPVALVFSFHLLMSQLGSTLKTRTAAPAQRPEEVIVLGYVQENVRSDVPKSVQESIPEIDKPLPTADKVKAKSERIENVSELFYTGVSPVDIASRLGVSLKTIQRDIKLLTTEANGHGAHQ